MKKIVLATAVLLSALCLNAQTFTSAMDYMNYMADEYQKISTDMWSYTSAVAHGKRARKIENRRKELVSTLNDATKKIAKMPGFEGDVAFRDSVVSCLKMSTIVITQDYSKIVDMEAISEQSYDQMEAYMTAQGIANQKLDAASEMVDKEQRSFAAKHNITINDNKDKLGQNLEKAGVVFRYYNALYLIFFKSYKQEMYMLDAAQKEDVNALEQNRNSLISYATAGLAQLDTTKGYKNDASVKLACQKLLVFYKKEASEKVPQMTDFILKKEILTKKQAALENKPAAERTQKDIDEYNKLLADFNKSANSYNAMITNLSGDRERAYQTWDQAVQNFLDRQIPKNN